MPDRVDFVVYLNSLLANDMNSFPFLNAQLSLRVLRVAAGLLMMAHGTIRIIAGTVDGFGEFLDSEGLVIGAAIAWLLTLFEIAGGAVLAAGYFVKWIAAIFIVELAVGIFLVHLQNGWFVVGYQSGGVEYSVLLIIVFLTVAAQVRK